MRAALAAIHAEVCVVLIIKSLLYACTTIAQRNAHNVVVARQRCVTFGAGGNCYHASSQRKNEETVRNPPVRSVHPHLLFPLATQHGADNGDDSHGDDDGDGGGAVRGKEEVPVAGTDGPVDINVNMGSMAQRCVCVCVQRDEQT